MSITEFFRNFVDILLVWFVLYYAFKSLRKNVNLFYIYFIFFLQKIYSFYFEYIKQKKT